MSLENQPTSSDVTSSPDEVTLVDSTAAGEDNIPVSHALNTTNTLFESGFDSAVGAINSQGTITTGTWEAPSSIGQASSGARANEVLCTLEERVSQTIDTLRREFESRPFGDRPDPEHVQLFDRLQSDFQTAHDQLRQLHSAASTQCSTSAHGFLDHDPSCTLPLADELERFKAVTRPYLRHHTPFIEDHFFHWRDATRYFDGQATALFKSLICDDADKCHNRRTCESAFERCKSLAIEAKQTIGSIAGVARQIAPDDRPIQSLTETLATWSRNVGRTTSMLDIASERDKQLENEVITESLVNLRSRVFRRKHAELERRYNDDRTAVTSRLPSTSEGLESVKQDRQPDYTGLLGGPASAPDDLSDRLLWYDQQLKDVAEECEHVLGMQCETDEGRQKVKKHQLELMSYGRDVYSRLTELKHLLPVSARSAAGDTSAQSDSYSAN
ncbi:hypothetical protein IAU59_006331 [Kwoniella sp. CBS 9459]